jgi:BASS family bile acid:Na+ symporter
MAAGLAKSLGKVATLGLVPIVFGPVMNIIASVLANWWRSHPPATANTPT